MNNDYPLRSWSIVLMQCVNWCIKCNV